MNKAEQLRYEYYRVKELTNTNPTDANFKRLAEVLAEWDKESSKLGYDETRRLRKQQLAKNIRIRKKVIVLKDGIKTGPIGIPEACKIVGSYHKQLMRHATSKNKLNGYLISFA